MGGREEGTATDWVIGSLVRGPRGIYRGSVSGESDCFWKRRDFGPFGLCPSWAMGLLRLATLICMEKAF
jgi:hypothetical protein